ncbi:unnamed protein product, partial [marine sediment metagenome]
EHLDMSRALAFHFPRENVELWHTGGGCYNPVLVFSRDSSGSATRYLMFSDGWYPEEASFGLYQIDPITEEEIGIGQWYETGDSVPTTPRSFVELVRREIGDALQFIS